ncbi:hypothetical protein [Blastopirellula marina]|uniref:Uncharacterized protein n=1 Tax=Blastopirellula marina TaxID=124 RepID=A0A2S8F516_9BACT|nr:hypothetical protein [Blastopirellula marina]PQO27241.1 hypothetical protein C5Y98_28810 [Blastopirellula marina]PTL41387.1 hypothetical protein C5Y97_28825 [Blastopirellula marina]
MARKLDRVLAPWYLWYPMAALVGAFPMLLSYLAGITGGQLVSSLLLTPLLVAAVARDSLLRGLGALALAFLAHCVVVISLASFDPQGIADIYPRGEAYWQQTYQWVVTGESPEYELLFWLGAHIQLVLASTLFSFTSLGMVTLWQGFQEVDLMNCYVGNMLNQSQSPMVTLFVGWHIWSVCRGLGYLVLTFEVVSYSLERLSRVHLSTRLRRITRWQIGLGFLVLDGVLKYNLLEIVRQALEDNLTA